jgi:TonB-dependent receptor
MTDSNTKRLPTGGGRAFTRMGWLAGASALALHMPALQAQATDGDVAGDQSEVEGEITVTGIRDTIQNSIDSKRNSDLVFDALSADEIGDLPALSIGEALETLTGAGSHREQGGATEISIRGLGPFLGSTVINGRIATNGSGDRSVNFSQFPSELFNQVGIYKTQSASQIEGGVAGQIVLDTVKPLDYGRRRIQGEFKLNINPDNLDIDPDQRFQKFGYRGTLSYVDQLKLGDGEIGLALGYQRNNTTNPEQEAAVSNTLNYCRNDPARTTAGVGDDGNCNAGSPRPAVAGPEDFVIARNGYSYRQNITEDTRDSFFAAVQWQPSPTIDINADFQYSKRLFRERRNDLNFSEGRRIDDINDAVFNATGTSGNRLPFDLIVSPTGALQQFTGETSIETNSEYLEREEEYFGGGLSLEWQASDRLTLSADLSYSQTQRIEEAVQVRQRIRDDRDIFGVTGRFPDGEESDGSNTDDRIETAYLIAQNGSQIPNFVVRQFDVNDHDLFSDNARTRYDLEQDRFNSVWGARADFDYALDGFLSSIQGGIRYQDLAYRDVPGAANGSSRVEVVYNNAALAVANQACRTAFPESGFLSSVSGGNPLVTNVDNLGNVIGTTDTFATFDALCLARTLQETNPSAAIAFDSDGLPIYPTGDFDSTQNSDVREKTYAVYLQANYAGDLGSLPVRGNIGLRVVQTDVMSSGFRTTLTSLTDVTTGDVSLIEDRASLTVDVAENSYTEFLPSFNLTADLQPDLLGRFAVYRALSRPDPSSLSFGRQFAAANGDDDAQSVVEALGVVSATGNPFTDPLLSWNIDVGLEWYPNPDTILAFNAYYKSFNGGFETIGQQETFLVDGAPVNAFVSTVQTTDETSTIYGLEITAAHRLSWLPAPLDGLGFKLSYNYADSNFEFEDDTLGAVTRVGLDGTLTTMEALIAPANLFGFSKHVLSAQAYYQIGGLDLQGVYKYRSNYFQQFIDTPGRVRYVDDVGVIEARISYKLTDNIRLSLEGLNLFNEPRTDFRGAPDDLGQVLAYGPRYFAGVRVKF